MLTSLPQDVAASGVRKLIVIGIATLLTITIWTCLVSGIVFALRPALGTAGAFFAVCGGLSVFVLLGMAALSAYGSKTTTRRTAVQDEVIAIAMTALQSRRGRQLALGSLGALLLIAAVLMSNSAETEPER